MSANYSGASVGGHDATQHSAASRHSSILGGSQDADLGGYRAHTSATAQYGGQYSSVYGSAALSTAQVSVGYGLLMNILVFNYCGKMIFLFYV